MKSAPKDKEEVEVEVDETMIETPTDEMDVEVESEELQEAQAPSIVDDSLVCLSCLPSPFPSFLPYSDTCFFPPMT